MSNPTLILGAGIAGLGAAYKLKSSNRSCIVLEKDSTYGGLCGNFTIDGFRFDRFVHFSFAKDEQVNRIFMDGAGEVFRHVPNAYNLYQGIWIKHPAQNNLYPLSQKMKDAVVRDFYPVRQILTLLRYKITTNGYDFNSVIFLQNIFRFLILRNIG